jgi:hypothetical protein
MIGLFLAAIAYGRTYVISRHRLALEVAALRQQLVVFKRKRPNEEHLMQLGNEYVHYYHDDRTHIRLGKQTPGARLIEQKANCSSEVCGEPRLGGLHHRYTWAQAA